MLLKIREIIPCSGKELKEVHRRALNSYCIAPYIYIGGSAVIPLCTADGEILKNLYTSSVVAFEWAGNEMTLRTLNTIYTFEVLED